MSWSLAECRKRAGERYERATGVAMYLVADQDRAQLLDLVDRMRPCLDHKFGCVVARQLVEAVAG